MTTVSRSSRKLNRPTVVLSAWPAKFVTHEVWMLLRISLPRRCISGNLNDVYCATVREISS